jgi:lipid II:glycine glycyltransferase (peptidoglycan interpeptide bridge formation enzyme)
MIGKAEQHGIKVESNQDEVHLETFYRLFLDTRKRLSLPPIPLRFFKSLQECLASENCKIFLAFLKGIPIGGLLVLKFNRVFSLEFTGNIHSYRKTGVNQLLYWKALQMAFTEKYRIFSFGRTSLQNSGLLDYKGRWGAIEKDVPTFIYPYSATNHSRESSFNYRLVKGLARHMPLPLFKLFGEFCYRHLG